jgi:hypothetical protein
MAVAMSTTMRTLRILAAAMLPAFCLAACMTSGAFNHDAHLPVVKGACTPCHGSDPEAPRAVVQDDCAACHPQLRGVPPGAAGKYGESLGTASEPRPATYGDVVFAHKAHAKAGVACTACHPAKVLSGKPSIPAMSGCTGCHEKQGLSGECSACHRERRKTIAPPSHDAEWEGRHGEISRTMMPMCTACHDERSCSDCHATRKPQSHVGGWDKSAHGFQALEDRAKCATCHEAAYCTRCHSVPPPSHGVPNFRFAGHRSVVRFNARSCAVCHERSFCQQCHT